MTREEVKRMNRPSSQASESVIEWLHGQTVLSANIEDKKSDFFWPLMVGLLDSCSYE